MADEKVIIELDLVLDDDTVKKAIGKIPKEAKNAGKQTGKAIGDSMGSEINKSLNGAFSGITRQLGAFAAVALGAFAFNKLIDGALAQEDAVNKLNAALKQSGNFTKETSDDLQAYASELQKVTKFGDEVTLEQLAFAQAMGATAEESKKVVAVAADLSTALGIDLNSATKGLAKTLSGTAGELARYVPELSKLSAEQLKNGEAVKLLGDRYKGFAEEDVKTTAGQIQQLKNSVGDLAEELGFLITKQDGASLFFDTIRTAVDFYTESLGNARKASERDLKAVEADIDSINKKVEELKKRREELSDGALLKTINYFDIKAIDEQIDQLKVKELEVSQEKIKFNQEAAKQQEIKKANILKTEADEYEARKQLLIGFGVFREELAQEQFLKEYEAAFALFEQKRITDEQFQQIILESDKKFEEARGKIAEDGAKERAVTAKQANQILQSVTANGIAGFAKALANGENAGEAFKDALLGSIGDLATQLGTVMIAAGVAELNFFTGNPTGSIAAGAALVALGQILSNVSGSGLKSFGGGGSSAGVTTADSFATSQIQSEPIEPETKVVVNIQGNILDSQESGSYIIDAINKAVDGTGATLRRNAIA